MLGQSAKRVSLKYPREITYFGSSVTQTAKSFEGTIRRRALAVGLNLEIPTVLTIVRSNSYKRSSLDARKASE